MAGSMRSKKTTEALQAKLSRLKHSSIELAQQAEKMWKEIQGWPVEVIAVHGQKFKARRVVSQQVDRTYDDSLRELGRIAGEIRDTELLLHPPKGRPKGRRNERSKPPDPTFVEARKYRKTPEGRKLTLLQLAQKFSGGKNRVEWGRWKYRFKKDNQQAPRSRS